MTTLTPRFTAALLDADRCAGILPDGTGLTPNEATIQILMRLCPGLETELTARTAELEEARKQLAMLQRKYDHLHDHVTGLAIKPNNAKRPSFLDYEVLPPDGTKAP